MLLPTDFSISDQGCIEQGVAARNLLCMAVRRGYVETKCQELTWLELRKWVLVFWYQVKRADGLGTVLDFLAINPKIPETTPRRYRCRLGC